MLTAREAKILELLAVNKNEVVRRDAVLSRFWDVEDKDYLHREALMFSSRKFVLPSKTSQV